MVLSDSLTRQLESLSRGRVIRAYEHHPSIGSTNDRALELAAAAELDTPTLIVADEQTAGRGRGANRWWAAPGSLTFSLIVDSGPTRISPARLPRQSLAAGLAICKGIESVLPQEAPRLKWPNDVYLRLRKVCGILIEGVAGAAHRLVIGVGINVNNSFAEAPAELREKASSLADLSGQSLDRGEVLAAVVENLVAAWEGASTATRDVAADFAPYCLLTDRLVQVRVGAELHAGLCRGIAADGGLILETETGRRTLYTGIVERFE